MSLAVKLRDLSRRLWRRVPVGIPGQLEWNGQRYDATCRNISLGGAFVESSLELPLGSIVTLHLCRPHVVENVALKAEARWHEVGGAGLRFIDPSARDLWVLSAIAK